MSVHNWLHDLRSALAPSSNRRRHRRRRSRGATLQPCLEKLEDRCLLSFDPIASFPVDPNPQAVVTGDFNGDGRLDLATGNPVANTVSVLLGDGAGGFGDAIDSSLGLFSHDTFFANRISLTVADFNNDGHDDLAMTANNVEVFYWSGTNVLLSNGDGTFAAPTYASSYTAGYNDAVAAGDFNNDGNSDLVVTGFDIYAAFNGFDVGVIQVLPGDGQGAFAEAAPFFLFEYSKARLTVGDLNGDGDLDVVALDGEYGGSSGVALLGDGAGGFVSEYDFYSTNWRIREGAVGDFTGDGIPDLAVAGVEVDIFVGRGDGTFEEPTYYSANGNVLSGVAVADFNGDGLLDAVTSDADTGTVSLLPGDGNGTLTYAAAYAVGLSPSGIVVGDFNGDGRPDAAVANAGSNSVSVLLNDGINEQGPWLRIDTPGAWGVAVHEGNTGTTSASFVVTLSPASTETVTVAYATADDSATAGSDYQPASGTLTFAPGETTKTITVLVYGDREFESAETFVVNLSDPTNAIIASGQGLGTIWDDEPRIHFVPTVQKAEGDTGQTLMTFYVLLPNAQDLPVTVDWETADGSAVAGSDYVASGGTLTFAPGDYSKTITVAVIGDTIYEPDETFVVNLTGATNAIILESQSLATIYNDDSAPWLTINDVSVLEGNSGTALATFTVTLNGGGTETITVDFATADGTATAGSDYQAASGTLIFNPGETSKSIAVLIYGDTTIEPDETFIVNLSNPTGAIIDGYGQGVGTIANDDIPLPALSITDVSRNEGHKGKTGFTFTVTLSQPSTQTVRVNFATADGTATVSNSDYTAKNGTLTFQPGQTSKTITVSVRGDKKAEADETFFVNLSSAQNALFGDGQGVGTIVNDDGGSLALDAAYSDWDLMDEVLTGRKRK